MFRGAAGGPPALSSGSLFLRHIDSASAEIIAEAVPKQNIHFTILPKSSTGRLAASQAKPAGRLGRLSVLMYHFSTSITAGLSPLA